MSTFVQIHSLRCYPPSNLNRDNNGAPKQVDFGDSTRLRISSQCLKKHYREAFIVGARSTRTMKLPQSLFDKMRDGGIDLKDSKKTLEAVFQSFFTIDNSPFEAKNLKNNEFRLKQITTFTPEEVDLLTRAIDVRITELSPAVLEETKEHADTTAAEPTFDDILSEIKTCNVKTKSLDVACFGRMLADAAEKNIEAAVQVSHAISANAMELEDDFFTAVDDLNRADEQGGAHLGNREFSSGAFYHYVNINVSQLEENLEGASKEEAIAELIKTIITAEPTGYQNSFAAKSLPFGFRVEVGEDAPVNLAMAYFKAVEKDAPLSEYIDKMNTTHSNFKKSYGGKNEVFDINALDGEGSMDDVISGVLCAIA